MTQVVQVDHGKWVTKYIQTLVAVDMTSPL